MLTCLVWTSARDGEQLSIMIHEWASAGPGSDSGVSVAAAGCCRGGMVVTARCRVTSGESSGGHQHQLPPSSWAQQCSAVTSGDTVTWTSVNSEAAAAMQWSAPTPGRSPVILSSTLEPGDTMSHSLPPHIVGKFSSRGEGRWSPWKHGHSAAGVVSSVISGIYWLVIEHHYMMIWCIHKQSTLIPATDQSMSTPSLAPPPFNLFILSVNIFNLNTR